MVVVTPSFLSACGVLVTLGIAYLFSLNRHAISWRFMLRRIILLFVWALLLSKTVFGEKLLAILEDSTTAIQQAAQAGISFVFGSLGSSSESWGFVFAFQALPVVIFFSALVSVLTHLGVIQRVVFGLGAVLRPLLGTTGPETTSALAKSFLGLMEGPLVIRAYFAQLNRSELFTVMVAALGMVSAALFPVYARYGISMRHLIAANLMGIVAVIIIAKMIVPEEKAQNSSDATVHEPSAGNSIDALISGTRDGLAIALNTAALLIAFIGCMTLLNNSLFALEALFGLPQLGIQDVLGYLLWPFGYLLGVDATDTYWIGHLLGVKITMNELIAYGQVSTHHLSARAQVLVTYALCGFGNIAGMGIVVGGLGTLMPDKHVLLSQLSWRALVAATLANLLSAYCMGMLL